MNKRKTIALIISSPEEIYQQRVLDGMYAQCERYGYNIAVFTPLVQVCHYYKQYLEGELNIFELMNFDELDGVVVASISLSEDNTSFVREYIGKKLKSECSKPVVSLDLPLEDYPVVHTDDRTAFSVITAHMLDAHGCEKIYFLTGMKGYAVAEQRLDGFRDIYKKRGLEINEDHIFYGDFWYTSGEQLADRIASGELEMPDAIICASDHMAIGVANRLIKNGFRIPEDVIISGYDATAQAAINTPTITTYIPDVAKAVAEAINYIRSEIEPGAELIKPESHSTNGIRICSSCGCPENFGYIKQRLNASIYNTMHNYGDENTLNTVDISRLLDSYMIESLSMSKDPKDLLWHIYSFDYLTAPYKHFYLCLRENWLDTDVTLYKGYPEQMNISVHTIQKNRYEDYPEQQHVDIDNTHMFDTKLMLPALHEEWDKPQVFFFTPIHFIDNTLGYSVLQCDMDSGRKIDHVFRNWVRNINTSLEMMRMQNRLTIFSERDAMTGLYNRRGMESAVEKMKAYSNNSDKWLIFVIDMDGLKYINDNYGHTEGDFGITAIASAARQITKNSDICVRAGGDEFYIICLGDFSDTEGIVREQRFNSVLAEINTASGKPYEVSASIGWCCEPVSSGIGLDGAIQIADSRMYENKCARKKQRK